MTRRRRPRSVHPHSASGQTAAARARRLLVTGAIVCAILLLLVRMLRFVHGHGGR